MKSAMSNMSKIIFLDTETTGLSPNYGHRIIEIACYSTVNGDQDNVFHHYLNPERSIDPAAEKIHGLNLKFLADKPKFADIAEKFIAFINQQHLVIHNAPFDIGFLEHELRLCDHPIRKLSSIAKISDSLAIARKKYPGKKNSLDALCKRYQIDRSQRHLHGALIDTELLAKVYRAMMSEQHCLTDILPTAPPTSNSNTHKTHNLLKKEPTREEMQAHTALLNILWKDQSCIWQRCFPEE
jgi:DNA polymerase III subunit epsilon